MKATRIAAVSALALVALMVSGPGWAEEGDDKGWSDTAEFAYVATGGNSESSTLGFKNTLTRAWEKSAFTLKAGGVRVDSTKTSRSFVDDGAGNVVFDESSEDETTAENYYLNGRYDRDITERFFWYGSAGWDRNRFAGIDNRYSVAAGVGNIWLDTDDVKFKTDYALTYTDQEDLSGSSESFAGARASWDYLNKFGESASYSNVLILDLNLDETSDWRADMINSVAVSLTTRMALKVSLQLLYDAEPSFKNVDVVDLAGMPFDPPRTLPYELDDLDTIFTASLVVNF